MGHGAWGVGCGVWGVGCGVWGVGCRERRDEEKIMAVLPLPYTLQPTPNADALHPTPFFPLHPTHYTLHPGITTLWYDRF
ncbi:MAG: hypothetical protein F6J93_22385 [Oscillatoria sp. SIO1A7]|nr:hypothetical protein [Oscillatoria sp. SIO1A7]